MLRSVAALLLVVCVLVTGCRTVTQRPTPPNQSWEARRALLQGEDHFQLKGRVAVATGNEGFNARLRWSQSGAQTHMSLDGPLGAGGVQVSAEGGTLSIVTSRGEHLDSDAARAELATRLGFDPPLESLRYWILGVPRPGEPAGETLDDQARLVHLQQEGWEIDYPSYMPAEGGWRPSRLTLQRANIRLKVIVEDWNS